MVDLGDADNTLPPDVPHAGIADPILLVVHKFIPPDKRSRPGPRLTNLRMNIITFQAHKESNQSRSPAFVTWASWR